MNISQVAAVAASFEASRVAGAQQAVAAASATTTQRQASRNATDADLRRTEVVNESDEKPSTGQSERRLVDITV